MASASICTFADGTKVDEFQFFDMILQAISVEPSGKECYDLFNRYSKSVVAKSSMYRHGESLKESLKFIFRFPSAKLYNILCSHPEWSYIDALEICVCYAKKYFFVMCCFDKIVEKLVDKNYLGNGFTGQHVSETYETGLFCENIKLTSNKNNVFSFGVFSIHLDGFEDFVNNKQYMYIKNNSMSSMLYSNVSALWYVRAHLEKWENSISIGEINKEFLKNFIN